MSIYDRVYTCRFAPASADWRQAIHNGIRVAERGQAWLESFASDAFIASDKPVPVVLSHEEDKVVGSVVVRVAHGPWHYADFQLDASKSLAAVAVDRLKVGTRVSPGFTTLRHDPIAAQDNIKRHLVVRLNELSILRPDEIPAFKGAQVTSIYEPRNEVVLDRDVQPGDEVIYGGQTITRYFETEITIR